MNSNGDMYADEAFREMIEKEYGDHDVKPIEQMEKDALSIGNEIIALELARLNHDARRVYYSERRRGASETDALATARSSILP